MAEALYPHATHIVDVYHAREHLTDLAAHLAFITPDPATWLASRSEELGSTPGTLTRSSGPPPHTPARRQGRRTGQEAGFRRNAHRMRYADFKKLGMFIGSGAIEGGIKAIVCQCPKQAGMRWNVDGAADIMALRTQYASSRWDEFWPARTAQPAGLRAAI
jgi:hypothetical protein